MADKVFSIKELKEWANIREFYKTYYKLQLYDFLWCQNKITDFKKLRNEFKHTITFFPKMEGDAEPYKDKLKILYDTPRNKQYFEYGKYGSEYWKEAVPNFMIEK